MEFLESTARLRVDHSTVFAPGTPELIQRMDRCTDPTGLVLEAELPARQKFEWSKQLQQIMQANARHSGK